MLFSPPQWLVPSIAVRTRFIDTQVVRAIEAGINQVVICGAGYDDRALRFRTTGVRFIELDHPATQTDKARLLSGLGGSDVVGRDCGRATQGPAVTLASIDFCTEDVGEVLEGAGHRPTEPSLFVAEGLLVYLDVPTGERLLAGLARRAAPGSALVATLATHDEGFDSAEVVITANSRRRGAVTEPWRTILPVAGHLALLERAGWQVTTTEWSPAATADVSHGRRSLLVAARI
jgi:methyltransferase (TIGR00027 family)